MTVLKDLSSNPLSKMSKEELIKRLQEMEQAKSLNTRPLKCKVSAKGALSIYGLNARFPVTLYRTQWDKLIEFVPEISKFIQENSDKFAVQGKE